MIFEVEGVFENLTEDDLDVLAVGSEDVQLEDEELHLNDALVQPLDVLEFLAERVFILCKHVEPIGGGVNDDIADV